MGQQLENGWTGWTTLALATGTRWPCSMNSTAVARRLGPKRTCGTNCADARRAAGGQARRCHRPAAAAPAVRMVWHTAPRREAKPAKAEAETAKPAPEPPRPNITSDIEPPAARPLPIMPDFADLNPDTPHLAGWTRNGTPIYRGTQAEWRKYYTARE